MFHRIKAVITKNKKDLYFIFDGKIKSFAPKIKIGEFHKKSIKIFVFKMNKKEIINNEKENNIICPEADCKNLAFLSFNDDKVSMNCSIKNHSFINLNFKKFLEIQNIDKSKIICCECNNNKYFYGDIFYVCSCDKYICDLCYISSLNHQSHKRIKYNERFAKCNRHSKIFLTFCNICNVNLCEDCEKVHNSNSNHKIINFKQLIQSEKKYSDFIQEIKDNFKRINFCKSELEKLNKYFSYNFKYYINEIENYSKFYEKILESSEFINCETLKNIMNLKNKKLLYNINDYLTYNFKTKIKVSLENFENIKNEINITYKNIYNESRIKLFGEKFVKNNKEFCILVVDNMIFDLYNYYSFEESDKKKKDKIVKIKLITLKKITNMSHMFSGCRSLISLPDICNYDTSEVIDMSFMFFNCINLKILSDISKWNTSNVINMSYMFYNCKNIYPIPNISNWDINKVENMNDIFFQCKMNQEYAQQSKWNKKNNNEFILNYDFDYIKSGKKLFGTKFVEKNKDKCFLLIEDEIFELCEIYKMKNESEENTEKEIKVKLIQNEVITDLSYMFNDCDSIVNLPDISELNTSNITNMSYLFYNCKSLKLLPDISKWDMSLVTDISYMFYNCKSLVKLPDISNWNTNNLLDINNMFSECSSLISIPDISKWKTNNIKNMSYLFYNCNNLKNLPDISNWDLSNVSTLKSMFSGCTSIESLPEIIKWDFSNISDISYMFYECESLKYLPDFTKWKINNVQSMSYLFDDCFSLNFLSDLKNFNIKLFTKENELSIIYKYNSNFSKQNQIRIFGEQFVKNNIKNCKLIINGKESDLSQFYQFDTYKNYIKLKIKLIIKDTLINLSHMFCDCNTLFSLFGFMNLNTKQITDLSYMFYNCDSLSSLPDISYFDMSSVTDISYMFYNCESLTSIPNLFKRTKSKIKKMNNLFNGCSSLETIPDISKLDISNVTDISYIFYGCKKIVNIPNISNWNTKRILNMSYVFYQNSNLLSIPDISKWNTSNVTNMSFMFYGCSSLNSLPDITRWNINKVIDMSYMFYQCSKLKSLSFKTYWDNNQTKYMNYIFYDCSELTSLINFTNWNLKEVYDINNIFYGCNKLIEYPDISKWNIKVMIIKYKFKGKDYNPNKNYYQEKKRRILGKNFCENNKNKCYLLIDSKKLPLNEFYNLENDNELEVQLVQEEIITNMSYMFSECNDLLSLSLILYWNTKHFTDISHMFYNCTSLISLSDLSLWNTINVTKMNHLFYGCKSLLSIPDISKWDIQNVSDISYIFYGCNQLKTLPNISYWNTNNVVNIKSSFANCNGLTILPDISKWNTNNINDISYLFFKCEDLESLPDISKWNTNNVNDMSNVFNGCSKLTNLPDLSKWNINNVKKLKSIFAYCRELKKLPDISKWNTSNVKDASDLIIGCKNLNDLPDISHWDTNNMINKDQISKILKIYEDSSMNKNIPETNLFNFNNNDEIYKNLENINNEGHTTFEEYIKKRKKQCEGFHQKNILCKNCMPPAELNYNKLNNCKNHPPEKYCDNCMPNNIILKKQSYNHVDNIIFMNPEEIVNFLNPWIDEFFQIQKIGYLYGYYERKLNDEIYAIVEAIYEPLQIGDPESFLIKDEKDKILIDKISKNLKLECIGWIFTSLKEEKLKLKGNDLIQAAKYQQQHNFLHSSGCHISRFITCVVCPNDLGEYKYETYMVSDMCQALVRDNIFGEIKDNNFIEIKSPKTDEIFPLVSVEGIETKIFDPNYFIIDIKHEFVSEKKGKNIIKSFDFPVIYKYNRTTLKKMIKEYFKKNKKVETYIKCANLYFLLYIAKNIDLQTALNFAEQIKEKSLDWEIVETLLNNYIEE